jgi:hypothetical protein
MRTVLFIMLQVSCFLFANGGLKAETTVTKQYYSVESQSTPGNTAKVCDYWKVVISDEGDKCDLECWGRGEQCCRWFDPTLTTTNQFNDQNGLFKVGQVQDLMNYADNQVANNIYAGSHTANINVNGTLIYRNVTWTYTQSNGCRQALVTVTRVTP